MPSSYSSLVIGDTVVRDSNVFGIDLAASSNITFSEADVDVHNNTRDVVLTFGTRADLSDNNIGSVNCDATVLVRGNDGVICPAP